MERERVHPEIWWSDIYREKNCQQHFELRGGANSGQFRILYLTNQLPLPAHSGGQLRESETLKRLSRDIAIELVVLTNQFERDRENSALMLPYCANLTIVRSASATEGYEPHLPKRVASYRSSTLRPALELRLAAGGIDAIHVEGYFMMRHLPDVDLPIVLCEENIEYLLDKTCEELGDPDSIGWNEIRHLEHEAWQQATICGTVSIDDLEIMRRDAPDIRSVLLPCGFDHVGVAPPRRHADGAQVVFVGNYSWTPTRDAAVRLLTSIWPRVLQLVPDARLSLIGAGADASLRVLARHAPSVEFVGQVTSVAEYLRSADVFVCPVRMHGGVKIKLSEAFQIACPIVAAPEALVGFPQSARDAVVIAETDARFAAAIAELLLDPRKRQRLAARAHAVAGELPTWDDAATALSSAWRESISLGSSARRDNLTTDPV
ncbi:glycosyltransferase [Nocardia sp. NPDC049220]|uniref:glycosyltransferase n=1 Tax=Nocardia sp. NPDC049220 TaxID=3155273 RepID=UPI0033C57048